MQSRSCHPMCALALALPIACAAGSADAASDCAGLVNVKLEGTQFRMGRMMQIDPKSETFVNDTEGDAMLTRQYREPFVVPAKV